MGAKLLLAIVLSSPFWNLGHPLWEVDDARYAEVPREMAESGDWLTPRLDYCDYIEKPPLIYWLPAASYKLFGVREAAARLPNALLAFLGLLGVWWLGSWLFSERTGRWAAIFLGVSLEYFLLGHLLTPDMAVSVFLLWASGAILRCLRNPEDARWAGSLAWISMALAFLSKGLIALLLPGLWTALLLGLFPELRRGLKGLLLNWGFPAFIVLIGSWLAAMQSRHPDFLHVFFIEQHFQRFLTPKYARPGPWYYFFGVDAGALLPWTPLAWAGTILPFLRWRGEDPGRKQLALWAAVVFVFFSASTSKLPTYILPIFAHQAILAAELLGRLSEEPGVRRWCLLSGWVMAGAFLLAALAAPFIVPVIPGLPLPRAALWTACAFALAQALAVLALSLRAAPLKMAACACAANALLLAGAQFCLPLLSAKAVSLEIAARFKPGDRIIAYDKYLHGIPFYARRPVDVVNWVGELHYAKRMARFQDRFGDDDTIRKLDTTENRRIHMVLETRLLSHVLTLRPAKDFKRLSRFGNWILLEL